MARRRTGIPQKDFSLGEVRKESIERDDAELIDRSLWKAENTMILTTGALQARPGSWHVVQVAGDDAIEIEPESGLNYFLTISAGGLEIRDQDGDVVTSFNTATWTATEDVWINNLGDTILMGSQQSAVHALLYADQIFTFGLMSFADGAGGSLNQPYWRYRPDVAITPSATTGSITITADKTVFTQNYVGQRIRYVDREITIATVTSGTSATGTVVDDLPPTKQLTVASATGFRIGDAVEHSVLGGQGIITDISGSDIDVLVTRYFTGFDATGSGNDLVGPSARSQISAQSTTSPGATQLWDEPLMSPERGYAGASSEHNGRIVLNDFPQAPNVIAISAVNTYNDFAVGTNDDDAILDTVGAKSTRVTNVVSAEDMVILTSNGLYYQETRDGTALTPSNWLPVKFDRIGASTVRPARVSDGVVFVSKNGGNVMGAVLQGDIYKAWSVIPLSEFHSHLIKSPVSIGATDSDSDTPERFVFVCNSDGTAAVMRWQRGVVADTDTVGWVPWSTDGSYLRLFMAFGSVHAIIERTISGSTAKHLERLDTDAVLDSATAFPTETTYCLTDEDANVLVNEDGDCLASEVEGATHLASTTATVYLDGWDFGELTLDASGYPLDSFGAALALPSRTADAQIGILFQSEVHPWPRRSTDSAYGRQEAKRIIRLGVSVQDTIRFKCRNEPHGDYDFNADLEEPPALRTETAYFTVAERDHYPVIPIVKDRPGPFRITALRYRVQV